MPGNVGRGGVTAKWNRNMEKLKLTYSKPRKELCFVCVTFISNSIMHISKSLIQIFAPQ